MFRRRYTKLIFVTTFFFVTIIWPLVHPMVYNSKAIECGACRCPKKKNPVCVNENDDKKQFVTYDSPCEYLCVANCNEHVIKFLYCGACDGRQLYAKGHQGVEADFKCLFEYYKNPLQPQSSSETEAENRPFHK